MNKVTDIGIAYNSVISFHAQLHNQLRQLILSGHWSHGTRIPSESQLADHLKLSRSTVRLALQQAEIEGLIERFAGRGTFVAYLPAPEHRSRLIAFIACGFDAENHLLILNGAENELKARGYQIVFNNTQSHQEELDILNRLRDEDFAGVLLWPNVDAAQPNRSDLTSYHQFPLPIVLLDRTIHGLNYDCVTSDNYGGAQALMRHLVELGHQHVVFLSHYEMDIMTVAERHRAYRDVLLECSISPKDPWLIGQPGTEISATSALRSSVDVKSLFLHQIKEYMLSANPRPTAIFGVNDYLAVLAIRAMKLLDLPVPDAVSITGFDDTDLAVHLEVPLTTVAQDSFTIGKRAAQLLVDRIEGYAEPASLEVIATQLRLRSSTSVPVRL